MQRSGCSPQSTLHPLRPPRPARAALPLRHTCVPPRLGLSGSGGAWSRALRGGWRGGRDTSRAAERPDCASCSPRLLVGSYAFHAGRSAGLHCGCAWSWSALAVRSPAGRASGPRRTCSPRSGTALDAPPDTAAYACWSAAGICPCGGDQVLPSAPRPRATSLSSVAREERRALSNWRGAVELPMMFPISWSTWSPTAARWRSSAWTCSAAVECLDGTALDSRETPRPLVHCTAQYETASRASTTSGIQPLCAAGRRTIWRATPPAPPHGA